MDFVAKKTKDSKTKDSKAKVRFTTKQVVFMGLLSGLSYVLMLLESPPFLGFLRIELSDIPAIIGAFSYGPVAGIMIELIKNLLKAITASNTAFIGELANFIISVAYVVPAAVIYKKISGKRKAVYTFVLATISMTIVGFLVNYFITIPLYASLFGGIDVILAGATLIPWIDNKFTLILYGITPFNLVKGTIMGIVGYYSYQGIKKVM